MNACTITTIDNPWNPFTQFPKWWEHDHEFGYNSLETVAHFAKTSTELEPEYYNDEISDAIDLILEVNPFGLHIKIYEDEADELIKLANKAYADGLRNSEDLATG